MHAQADDRRGSRHAMVVVGREPPAMKPRRPDREPIGSFPRVTAEVVDLVHESLEPIGLMAAQMSDPVQMTWADRERSKCGDRRGEFADVVQVGVDSSDLFVQVRPWAPWVTMAPICWRRSRSQSPGWVVAIGQSATVTEPFVTSAAARKGAAFDRSGSIVQSWASTRAGATCQVFGSGIETSTP